MRMKWAKKIVVGVTAAFVLGFGAITAIHATAQAAPANSAATIGYIDAVAIKRSSVDFKNAQTAIATEEAALQNEFDEKSAGLSDAEKKQLFVQYQKRLDLKAQEVLTQVDQKINGVIKEVATAQGIVVVLDKSNVFYGGKDLTQDVIAKLK